MKNKLQIAVFGSDSDHCTSQAKRIAQEVGKEIAKAGAILLTGGGEGVMKAASQGAHSENGTVVGILPGADKRSANDYCDIIIPTEIGFARGQVLANAADAAIVIEGGFGTRNEVGETYWRLIPTIAIPNSGGTAAEVANTYLDKRRIIKVGSQESPQAAVKEALRLGKNRLALEDRLSAVGLDLSIYRATPQKYIRINPRDPIEIRELEKRLKREYEIECFFTETGICGVYSSSCPNIGGTIEKKRNKLAEHYIIQDLGSVIAVQALEIGSGNSYLEIGAAPGFKTVLAHDLWQGKIESTCVEINEERAQTLRNILAQYGVSAKIVVADGKTFQDQQYDRILIDAPCSCEGMIVKYDRELQGDVGGINKILEHTSEDVQHYQEEQKALLQNSFIHLKRGGTLVYVTCALNTQENEEVIDEFLTNNANARISLPPMPKLDINFQTSEEGIRIIPGKTKGLYFTRIIKE